MEYRVIEDAEHDGDINFSKLLMVTKVYCNFQKTLHKIQTRKRQRVELKVRSERSELRTSTVKERSEPAQVQ